MIGKPGQPVGVGIGNIMTKLDLAVAGLLDGVDLANVLGGLLQSLIDALTRLLNGLGGGAAAPPAVQQP